MSTQDDLLLKYKAWFEITLFEHHVIKEGRWKELNAYETKKNTILREIEAMESSLPSGEPSEDLRLLVHQLTDLEQLNQTLIQERMKETRSQISDVQRRQRTVRSLRKRYEEPGGIPWKFTQNA